MARPRTSAPTRSPAPPRRLPAAREPAGTGPQPARAGFVLYVGLQGDSPELDPRHAADLAEVAEALRDLARDLLPAAETYTALSLVPGTGPDDVRDLRARLASLQPLEGGGADADGGARSAGGGGALDAPVRAAEIA